MTILRGGLAVAVVIFSVVIFGMIRGIREHDEKYRSRREVVGTKYTIAALGVLESYVRCSQKVCGYEPAHIDSILEKGNVSGACGGCNGLTEHALKDYWGQKFVVQKGEKKTKILSLGKDARTGGHGQDADIFIEIEHIQR